MPTPLVVPNAGILKLRWSGETRTWLNVIGLIGVPTMPVVDQALANTLHAAIGANAGFISLITLLAPTVVWEGITIKNISSPNLPEFVSVGTPLSGGGTGDPLPLSVAACVTLRTSLSGKSFRGRVYFSGFTEAQNDVAGRQAPAVNTAAVAAISGIAVAIITHGVGVAVVSRPQAARTIPARDIFFRAGTATGVNAYVTRNSKWESQRRRTGRD